MIEIITNSQDFDIFDKTFEYNGEKVIPEIDDKDIEYTEDEINKLYYINRGNNEPNLRNTKSTDKISNIGNTRTKENTKSKKENDEIKLNVADALEQTIKGSSTIQFESNKIIRKLAKKIFNIVKEKKKNLKKGRLSKNLKKNYFGLHDKYSEDNIIRKIKASFLEKTMNYINKEYGAYLNKYNIKKISKLIQRISPVESRKIKKSENIKFFNSNLKEVFSTKISKKCTLYDPFYNKMQIDDLYRENKAKEIINIFDTNVSVMYRKYTDNKKMDGFETLEDDLRIIREEMQKKNENNINEYLEKYEYTAKNLEKIFEDKKSRNKKKKEIF